MGHRYLLAKSGRHSLFEQCSFGGVRFDIRGYRQCVVESDNGRNLVLLDFFEEVLTF